LPSKPSSKFVEDEALARVEREVADALPEAGFRENTFERVLGTRDGAVGTGEESFYATFAWIRANSEIV
jgi:hypothetical protein